MSAIHTPTRTKARPLIEGMTVRELHRNAITVRVSAADGTQWLALDRRNHDGTETTIGVPVTDGLRAWLAAALIETAP